jgi:energy-coupling factor transporter transmembrane protein EcfT
VFFRILVIVSLSILFTLTTDPGRMVESLIQVAKIPYRIGYTAYAVLRFIPLYENEAQVIINAHQIRGVGETGKSLGSRVKLYRSLLVPLLVSGIRRAQAASIAMDSRGFGAFARRTTIREVGVSRSTVAFVLLCHYGAGEPAPGVVQAWKGWGDHDPARCHAKEVMATEQMNQIKRVRADIRNVM